MKAQITKEIVEDYCAQFGGRYLTVKKYRTLSERERRFHFNGHWNILHDNGQELFHSYMCGGTGELKEQFSSIYFSELSKFVFIKFEETFILFKFRKRLSMKPFFVNNKLETLSRVTKHHLFLHENGISVKRKTISFDQRMQIKLGSIDVFEQK